MWYINYILKRRNILRASIWIHKLDSYPVIRDRCVCIDVNVFEWVRVFTHTLSHTPPSHTYTPTKDKNIHTSTSQFPAYKLTQALLEIQIYTLLLCVHSFFQCVNGLRARVHESVYVGMSFEKFVYTCVRERAYKPVYECICQHQVTNNQGTNNFKCWDWHIQSFIPSTNPAVKWCQEYFSASLSTVPFYLIITDQSDHPLVLQTAGDARRQYDVITGKLPVYANKYTSSMISVQNELSRNSRSNDLRTGWTIKRFMVKLEIKWYVAKFGIKWYVAKMEIKWLESKISAWKRKGVNKNVVRLTNILQALRVAYFTSTYQSKHSWCNGYCRMKWTQRYEFNPWTRLHFTLG